MSTVEIYTGNITTNITTDIPFLEKYDFVESLLFELILFALGYAAVMIAFVVTMFCCNKINKNGRKYKTIIFMITLILEVFDVVTDFAQYNQMKAGSKCGVTSCVRVGGIYADVMLPFIFAGAAITLFGNIIFFYVSFKYEKEDGKYRERAETAETTETVETNELDDRDRVEDDDDDTQVDHTAIIKRWMKIEHYAEIAKFWLEDIPVITIILLYILDPSPSNGYFYKAGERELVTVDYALTTTLYISLAFSGIDAIFSCVTLCWETFKGEAYEDDESKKARNILGCCTFLTALTTIALLGGTLVTAMTVLAKFAETGVISVNGECVGGDSQNVAVYYGMCTMRTSLLNKTTYTYHVEYEYEYESYHCGYGIHINDTKIGLKHIDGVLELMAIEIDKGDNYFVIFEPSDCTYSLPQKGECKSVRFDCEMGEETLSVSGPQYCDDVCTE